MNLGQLSVNGSRQLSCTPQLFIQPDGKIYDQNIPDVISGCLGPVYTQLKEQGFTESVAERVSASQRLSTRSMFSNRVQGFSNWAKAHVVDGRNPFIACISRFFMYFFDTKKLQPGSISGYKSALADYYPTELGVRDSDVLKQVTNFLFS